jgi:hypothetical protein
MYFEIHKGPSFQTKLNKANTRRNLQPGVELEQIGGCCVCLVGV